MNSSSFLRRITTRLCACNPEPRRPMCTKFQPCLKAIASETQSATPAGSSPSVAVDPCSLLVPEPRVINPSSNSNNSFLSNTTTSSLELYSVHCLTNRSWTELQPRRLQSSHSLYLRLHETDDSPSAPCRRTNRSGSTVRTVAWAPSFLGPLRVSIVLGRRSRSSMYEVCFAGDEYDMATVNLTVLSNNGEPEHLPLRIRQRAIRRILLHRSRCEAMDGWH